MMRFLLGPELFWLLMYLAASLLGKANQPPTKGLDDFIESLWFWIPAASLLVFGLWWLPGVEKNWLLLRVWVAGVVGGHLVLEKAMSAYSTQGPGIGMGYLAGLMLLLFLLVVGSVVVKIWG
ncbi:MAG: hypothetical protein IT261_09135 [Saprospiraceae bacterium]|nr:hypothetical protein [Saprospiraceae bacterium]